MLSLFSRRTLWLVALLAARAGSLDAQHFCDDPPTASFLTGGTIGLSGLNSEGHPVSYAWYITPPGGSTPTEPTFTEPTSSFNLDTSGLWSVALVTGYEHTVLGGGFWFSETCLTIEANSVVAEIELSSSQIATDESLQLSGVGSLWSPGVTPTVEWQVDGVGFAPCNGGPPPATPADLACTVPGDWLAPGWHTAGLLLDDPGSGESSLAVADFEVIEIIPLSVELAWNPVEPDPGALVQFEASIIPSTPESEFVQVVWDLGDGTVQTYTSCPPPYFTTCLEYPHTYATDGWYDVSVSVQTAGEFAQDSGRVKVGDPLSLPVASFTASPASPTVLETTSLSFDGSCVGSCTWSWDFGDGGISSAQNTSHAWQIPDSYTVSLTVTNEAGSDSTSAPIRVHNCWNPAPPTQTGLCFGEPILLTAASGGAWLWSTGSTNQTETVSQPGGYWVDVESGSGGCWGHTAATVLLTNCGDPGGDSNLDGIVDAADPAALITELTDGDGDTVIGCGGGDLLAPGGDANADGRLRVDDLLLGLERMFD